MKKVFTIALSLSVAVAAFGVVPSHWDGARTTPVHKLELSDKYGDVIVPSSENALPVSTRHSCNMCHDYDVIAGGWHFNASDTNACPGRFSEPWFMVDSKSGSQIPMSLRGWKGVYKPADLDMTNWEWVLAFGRHLPGGDIAEPEDIYAEAGTNARWEVSGRLEINCFACHTHDKEYDHSEYARLIARENFAWAASGALGIGDVGGMGFRVPKYWHALRGLDEDDKVYAIPPYINYHEHKFDAKNRVVLKLGEPRDENCLNCHSASEAGMPRHEIDGDVHLRAGMSCTDCHGNGLNHDIARGYDGEASGCVDEMKYTASCVGCHVAGDKSKAGRFGAPEPKHIGLPLIHFEKLSCTVCHSGVTKGGRLARVRTSKANRIGIYGRAIWATPAPFIVEPVFVKNAEGVIEPRRMSWPSYWATRCENGEIAPIKPGAVKELCAAELGVRAQVGSILDTLATNPNIPGTPALAIDGECFTANADFVAIPTAKDESLPGVKLVYLVEGTNSAVVVPDYDPTTKTDSLTDEQYEVYMDNGEKFNDLLQTLDAGPLAQGRYGAIVVNGKTYYRGGTDDAVISTNASSEITSGTPGYYLDNKFEPLLSDYVVANVKELGASECTLTENIVAAVLKKLNSADYPGAVYIAHGKVWEIGDGDVLKASDDDAAAPVSWAVGHDVRSARLARGAKPIKCDDCHTAGSDFFFEEVVSTGPMLTDAKMSRKQAEFMKVSRSYNKLFGLTFLVRPILKIFLWGVFGLMSLITVAFVSAGIPALLSLGGMREGAQKEELTAKIDRFAFFAVLASCVYLAISGAAGWIFHMMTGYLLMLHIVAGGLMTAALMVLIWTRGADRLARPVKSSLWMLLLALAVTVVFSAVAPMMTIFGSDWQNILLQVHRYSSFGFLIAGVLTLKYGKE